MYKNNVTQEDKKFLLVPEEKFERQCAEVFSTALTRIILKFRCFEIFSRIKYFNYLLSLNFHKFSSFCAKQKLQAAKFFVYSYCNKRSLNVFHYNAPLQEMCHNVFTVGQKLHKFKPHPDVFVEPDPN